MNLILSGGFLSNPIPSHPNLILLFFKPFDTTSLSFVFLPQPPLTPLLLLIQQFLPHIGATPSPSLWDFARFPGNPFYVEGLVVYFVSWSFFVSANHPPTTYWVLANKRERRGGRGGVGKKRKTF